VNRRQRRATAKSSQPSRAAIVEEGLAHHRAGRLERASALYRQALTAKPNDPDALYLFGVLRLQEGDPAEAVEWIGKAIPLRPNQAEMHCNLAVALASLGRFAEAVAAYGQAIAMRPDYVDAFNNRGNALCELNRHWDALGDYDRALAIRFDDADALNNRGNALSALDRDVEALASYDRALALKPDYDQALNNRGAALSALNRHEEAVAAFERLLRVKPDYEYAKGNLLHSRLHSCDWRDYHGRADEIRRDVAAGGRAVAPFEFLSLSDSPSAQLRCARTYTQHKFPATGPRLWNGERYSHDKIRVAYVSADFHSHAASHVMAGLYEAHDQSRFTTTAISLGPDKRDEMRTRLKGAFDRFIDVRTRSDRDVGRLMREMEIDIAVDLNGYTQGRRPGIFVSRPSPIQVAYLGFPGTVGGDRLDYMLADRFVIPEQEQSFYTEKIVYLPHCYFPHDSKLHISADMPTRREAGLPETGFVFCCFNNSYKLTPDVFDVWMRLLLEVEGSVLWLLGSNPAAVRNLRASAEQRGVAANRLVFAGRMKPEAHLARHGLAGCFLDTAPYNAHTTACYALFAGLPVVTCRGSSFAGRVAESALNAVGLPELIADDLEGYRALALGLARDEHRLAAIKAKLARNRLTSPLFDTAGLCRDIESAFETMWDRHQRGEPPASFAVAPIAASAGSRSADP
jgi:protein O-GlcNAc transferase